MKKKLEFEYYYKTDGCKAKDAQDAECVCWHDEGTGPYKDQRYDDEMPMVKWRIKSSESKPSSEPTGYAPCERHCEANAYQIEVRRLKSEMVKIAAALMRELHSDDVPDRVFVKVRDDVVLKLRSLGLGGV